MCHQTCSCTVNVKNFTYANDQSELIAKLQPHNPNEFHTFEKRFVGALYTHVPIN